MVNGSQRHAARPRRLVGQTDRHVESGIDLRYCREAHLKGMQESWLPLGGLKRKEKILIKGKSMKGVLLSKQHSLVVFLGDVA